VFGEYFENNDDDYDDDDDKENVFWMWMLLESFNYTKKLKSPHKRDIIGGVGKFSWLNTLSSSDSDLNNEKPNKQLPATQFWSQSLS
jgi:hypothetical protein